MVSSKSIPTREIKAKGRNNRKLTDKMSGLNLLHLIIEKTDDSLTHAILVHSVLEFHALKYGGLMSYVGWGQNC